MKPQASNADPRDASETNSPQGCDGALAERTEALSEIDARAVIDTAPDAIVIIDSNGCIEALNPATARLFGYEQEELLGKNVKLLMPEPHHSLHDSYLQRYFETGVARIIGIGREVEGRHKDGSVFPVRLSVGEVGRGGKRRFVGMLHDLSEMKSLQAQFLQSQKMEAVGVLAGGIAHDFNNLLTSISGSCELILEAVEPGSRVQRAAERIAAAADQAAAVTTRLLAFSRKQMTQPVSLDLNQAVREAQDLFMHLIGEDITVDLELTPGGVGALVDPGRLSQLLLNLVVNARDAMRGGGLLTLSTRMERLEAARASELQIDAGQYAVLSVADTGPGIPPEVLPKIFEPFFTTKEPGRGTGLGLSTAQTIAREHGGALTVESEPARGTCFRLYLPFTPVARMRTVERAADARVTAETQGDSILLVEDDALLRDLVTEVLELEGYKVLAASDPEDALVRVSGSRGRIDLAITDVVMPGMSGFALREALSKHQPHIRVLYMSGYTDRVLAEHGALRPEDTFIRKPFRNAELLTKVRETLSR